MVMLRSCSWQMASCLASSYQVSFLSYGFFSVWLASPWILPYHSFSSPLQPNVLVAYTVVCSWRLRLEVVVQLWIDAQNASASFAEVLVRTMPSTPIFSQASPSSRVSSFPSASSYGWFASSPSPWVQADCWRAHHCLKWQVRAVHVANERTCNP